MPGATHRSPARCEEQRAAAGLPAVGLGSATGVMPRAVQGVKHAVAHACCWAAGKGSISAKPLKWLY